MENYSDTIKLEVAMLREIKLITQQKYEMLLNWNNYLNEKNKELTKTMPNKHTEKLIKSLEDEIILLKRLNTVLEDKIKLQDNKIILHENKPSNTYASVLNKTQINNHVPDIMIKTKQGKEQETLDKIKLKKILTIEILKILIKNVKFCTNIEESRS